MRKRSKREQKEYDPCSWSIPLLKVENKAVLYLYQDYCIINYDRILLLYQSCKFTCYNKTPCHAAMVK